MASAYIQEYAYWVKVSCEKFSGGAKEIKIFNITFFTE